MSQISLSKNADTRDLRNLENDTHNVYLSATIIAKRANQISENLKQELRARLEPFTMDSDNLEEVHENREQIEISAHFEKLAKPTILALEEFLNEKTYWRLPEKNGNGAAEQ